MNDHRLHVITGGPENGPPVVLLHHGLGSVQAWKENIPALAAAGYRVIAYDRWGYGKSGARPRLSVPDFTPDLEDLGLLLSEAGLERVSLVGHSDGGTIALYFAAANPLRIACLVTVAAHVYVEARMLPGIAGIHQAYQDDPRFREGMQRVHGEKAEAVFANWYNAWKSLDDPDWDIRPLLANIACPVLVVQGMQDEHASPRHARDIAAAIPGAELWLAPEAGHMLPQDCAQEFNRQVVHFLDRCLR